MTRTGLTRWQRLALQSVAEADGWTLTSHVAVDLEKDVRSVHSVLQALERKRMIEGVLHEGHWWWRLAERGASVVDY